MLLYHRTNAADDILRDGFRDGEGRYMTDVILRGVWLSAVPLDIHEGAGGDHVLEVNGALQEANFPMPWPRPEGTGSEPLQPLHPSGISGGNKSTSTVICCAGAMRSVTLYG